jgi:hypothetical protein
MMNIAIKLPLEQSQRQFVCYYSENSRIFINVVIN